jgi:hypothetical protein
MIPSKLRPFLFSVLSFCAYQNSFSQTVGDASSYLEYIGNQYTMVSNDMMGYTSAASHSKSARKIEKKRTELMQSIKEAERNMRKMKPYKGDASLRDSVVSYFRITAVVLNEDYGKIVDMEEIAEQSYDLMEAYMLAKEKANLKLDEAFQKADNQYHTFATLNNIRLIETSSKLSKKMEEANQVMNYYNRAYLIFFKSYKDEAYFMDALNKGDVNALEQTKSALQLSSTEGLKKMSPTGTYQGDKSLKVACERMLEFYKLESSTKSNDITDYYLRKEKFEKSKKAIDAKRPGERAQTEIDAFNKIVNEFNASVNKFNQVNNDLNKRRNEALNAWNKVSSDFLDNHIPKHR